jgi:hypothetical protein
MHPAGSIVGTPLARAGAVAACLALAPAAALAADASCAAWTQMPSPNLSHAGDNVLA